MKRSTFYITLEEGIPVPILRDDNSEMFRYFVQPGDLPCSILQDERTGVYSFRDYRGTRIDTALLDTKKDVDLMRSWVGRITYGTPYLDLVKEYGEDNPEIEVIRIGNTDTISLMLAPDEEPRLCILNARAPFTKIREAVRKTEKFLKTRH